MTCFFKDWDLNKDLFSYIIHIDFLIMIEQSINIFISSEIFAFVVNNKPYNKFYFDYTV
jgi:hypothetical protein